LELALFGCAGRTSRRRWGEVQRPALADRAQLCSFRPDRAAAPRNGI